ncbi:MAG: OmcA/MtrC family decaheme c-type cytochrome [Shewanella sp.]|nr:OmcA/MtrC family decaheme c-type cytochrome [Shewanella sp.]MCF1437626.1 OmcA/MtrC family decaheme c-type cytochrome [Shewanella sp.]MCF1456208.1 OmcA/MtrC family decaheme c-type cytochrome [Shewanella sp.]
MMNTKYTKLATLIATGALTVALSGCGGDDGNPGKPGGPAAKTITELNLDITQLAHENGKSVVTVFATNEEDLPVVGLKDFEVKKAAQLIPQGASGAGNAAQWQITGSQKTFTDNKDGSYTFTIETEGYNPELTQRFNIIAAASRLQDGTTAVPRTEYTEDLASDGSEAKYSKNVVAAETCNSCHTDTKKIYHGYTDLDTCITCHNDEMVDDKGKVQVGFNHLIHNVHNSAKMYGKNMDKSAETAHAIVQDNCQTCHTQPADDNHELAEWGNWSRVPTMETCSSCHTDIDFKAGNGHSAQADNSNCIACHNASWTEQIHSGEFTDKRNLINSYGLESSLSINAENDTATISVGITDGNGNALDVQSLLSQIQQLETITNVGPNFPIMGYNPAPETGYKKVAKDLVKAGQLGEGVQISDNKLVWTTPALPVTADGSDTDTAFSFIGLGLCNDGKATVDCAEGVDFTGMKADLVFATKTDAEPSMRHINSVSFDTCIDCHGDSFDIHKGSRHPGFVMSDQLARIVDGKEVVGIDGCVSCHTPHGTYASGGNRGALEMKLHKTHSGFYDLIGGDCAQCHNDFNLDSFKAKGALATEGGYTTPITATCTSCHSADYMGHSKEDLENFGAIVDGDFTQATQAAQSETCLLCHKPTVANHGAVQI